MWELYEEIWEEQIGHRAKVGFDFTGREVHKEDFGNPVSKYGWTLLPFGSEGSYLVVHNQTMEEFPEVIDGEFVINGKTFEVTESDEEGIYEINEVFYSENDESEKPEEENIEFNSINHRKNNYDSNLEQSNENIKKYKNEFDSRKLGIENEIQELKNDFHWKDTSSDFENRKKTKTLNEDEYYGTNDQVNNNGDDSFYFKNQYDTSENEFISPSESVIKIDELKDQISFLEDEHLKEIQELQDHYNKKLNIEKEEKVQEQELIKTLNNKFVEQEKEIEKLRKQNLEQKTMEINLIKSLTDKFNKQEQELEELRKMKQEEQTIAIDMEAIRKSAEIEAYKALSKKIEEQNAEIEAIRKTQQLELQNQINSSKNDESIELRILHEKFNKQQEEINRLKEERATQERILKTQTHQIELNQKNSSNYNYDGLNNSQYNTKYQQNNTNEWGTDTFSFNQIKNEVIEKTDSSNFNVNNSNNPFKQWELKFGNKKVVYDYANQLMVKSEYGKNVEGGWGFDKYFKDDENSQFISSLNSILQRGGKNSFKVNDKWYKVMNKNGIYAIEEKHEKDYSLYSNEAIEHDVRNLHPEAVKKFNGKYESYASLLINLNHFPVDYLDKFEEFLNRMIGEMNVFKSKFIYINKKSYESGNSNITSYARVFFKYDSVKEQIRIIMVCAALRSALVKFVNQYRSKNNRYVVSFTMVLTNHDKEFKFIQAQTNYDILRTNPVPFRIPQYKLIIDKDFNSLLQFHENQLWKNIKPFALDHNGHTYYLCDVDANEYIDKID